MMLSFFLTWSHQRLRRDAIIVLEQRKDSTCPPLVMLQKDSRRQKKNLNQERYSSCFSGSIQPMVDWSTSSVTITKKPLSHGSLSALNVILIIICTAIHSLTRNGKFWTAPTTLAKNRLSSLMKVSIQRWMCKWDWLLKSTWLPTASLLVWWLEH